ncbi:MAG: Rrf2 family transcriptional regulator [Verrucomicrobia bacterium]|nr:Rrf2 family transcriptional regulator [Verrucomicrobiota bacterium]
MLTKTSVTATRLLIYLGLDADGAVASLKEVADQIGESPTYLAKIGRHLVRAGILRALRGKTGGVVLNRLPKDITLLAIVEACQGSILGNFCQETGDVAKTCALHQAGAELHDAIIAVLSRWTLADFIRRPDPAKELQGKVLCLLQGGRRGAKPLRPRTRK